MGKCAVAQLAAEAGYTRSHFSRLFKTQTGLSPKQYIINARIALANELLRAGYSGACRFRSCHAHLRSKIRQNSVFPRTTTPPSRSTTSIHMGRSLGLLFGRCKGIQSLPPKSRNSIPCPPSCA